MPLQGKDKKVLSRFEAEYGPKEGKRAFYGSINAGKVKNIPEARRMKRRKRRSKRR